MTITAEVICDSIGEHPPRLTTFLVVFPAFVEQELLRHRAFSFSSSSSRAVPVSKMLDEVRSDELRAAPVWWGREQKGMASGDELEGNDLIDAKNMWRNAAWKAVNAAEQLQAYRAHKSIVNRILAPFIHRRIVITTCEPGLMNFFGLRLDRAAQPEIRVLAEQMWMAWNESEPKLLRPGEWHLPFVDIETWDQMWPDTPDVMDEKAGVLHVSAARCARTSYLSFNTGRRSTIEEDLQLFDKLVGAAPMHLSPLEHQATPDEQSPNYWENPLIPEINYHWACPNQHGNLPGWIQFRKTIPGEAVAPLPKAYAR